MPRYHYQQSKTRHSTHIRAQANGMLNASDRVLAAASFPSDALPVKAGSHSRHPPSRALLCRFHSSSAPAGKKWCMRARIDMAEIVPGILIIYKVAASFTHWPMLLECLNLLYAPVTTYRACKSLFRPLLAARRSGAQRGAARLSVAWTGRLAAVKVTSQRFPRARTSGRPVLQSWEDPDDAFGHELSRPKRVSWLPAYGMMWATSIPVSYGGVKTHVFMDDLVVDRWGCLVNSIFMGRGAPGEHESSVAKLHF